MEITSEYEGIHQVTKHYDDNLKKQNINSKGEVVVEDLKSNCSKIIFETKEISEPLSREC